MERGSVRCLLDTAPWINGVTMPQVLPERIRRLVETPEPKGLCSVSLLEAAILHRLGRLELKSALSEFFAAALSADVQLLELTPPLPPKPTTWGGTSPVTHSTGRFSPLLRC